MDQWSVFDELKAGELKSVYAFYGPEAYIRKSAVEALKRRVLAPGLEDLNLTVLSAPAAEQVIVSCETLPLMSERRLVIVRDCPLLAAGRAKDEQEESEALCSYLPRVPQTAVLLFDAGAAVDKRKKLAQALLKLPGAVCFEPLDDARLAQWINKTLRPLGKQMDRETCAQLTFTSGRDLTALSLELQKLAAYAGDAPQITAQDVDALATRTAECTVFSMVDALCEGRAKDAFSLLGTLLQGGEQRIGIIALITRQVRQMTFAGELRAAGRSQGQIAKELAVPPFALGRLLRQAGRYGAGELRALLAACVQADYDVKRGALREDEALDRLMLRMLVRA